MLLYVYNGILVPVRASFGLRWCGSKTYTVHTYQRKVDVDVLNAVKIVLPLLCILRFILVIIIMFHVYTLLVIHSRAKLATGQQ